MMTNKGVYMNNLKNEGMDFKGIKYKAGRFNFLFMLIQERWTRSSFSISDLIVEAKRQKSDYYVNAFTDCYNAKQKRDCK